MEIKEVTSPIVNKVAIIGGGLGGLAVAIALRKQGIDAHVYERAQEFRQVGTGMGLAPNGLKCLDAIKPGIVEKLKLRGNPLYQINSKTKTGETIRTFPVTAMKQYGQPILAISWFDVQTTLASALPSDIIHLNHRCVGFEQNPDSVSVNFEGGKTVEADLLIGADGIHSTVRQTLIGDSSPRYVGRMDWRAVVKYSHELLPANEATRVETERTILLLLNVGSGYIHWSVGVLSEQMFMSESPSQLKSRVLETIADWASPAPEIIQATDAEAIVERPVCHGPTLSSWSRDRVTLLGDAAHAMRPALAQGANTAFEDAWELQVCLSHADTLETALRNYERSRIKRTQSVQARSALVGYRTNNPDFCLQDFEQEFGQMPEQARVSDAEFSEWLYAYDPYAIAQTIADSCRGL